MPSWQAAVQHVVAPGGLLRITADSPVNRVNLRFYVDPETGQPHLNRHGVSQDEAEDFLE